MKVARRLTVIAAVVLSAIAFWSYGTKVITSTASEFKPATRQLTLVPAGTRIPAILPYGITEGTKPGEKVVAFVSPPVMINNEIVIPQGARLQGVVEQIEENHRRASTRLNFSVLVLDNHTMEIHTDPLTATLLVTTDFQLLGNGFEAKTSVVLRFYMSAGNCA